MPRFVEALKNSYVFLCDSERNGGDRVPVRAAAEGDQPAEPAQVDHRAQAGGRTQELFL